MGHYFDEEPGTASTPRNVELWLPDMSLTLTTDRGVFGYAQIDAGTKLLLLKAPAPPAEGNLLDLGCGVGTIALPMARRAPRATVWAVDVNSRARDLCRANATTNDITNVCTAAPDDVPAELVFDCIWSNPPIRIGKPALHELLSTGSLAWYRAGTPSWSCTSTSAPTRCSGGSPTRATQPSDSPRRAATGSCAPRPTDRLSAPGRPRSAGASFRPGCRRDRRTERVPGRGAQQHDVAVRRRLQPGGRGELVGARTRHGRERGERRQAEQLSTAQLDLGGSTGIGMQHRLQHLVTGQERLHQQAATARDGRRPAAPPWPAVPSPARRPDTAARAARHRGRGTPRRRPVPARCSTASVPISTSQSGKRVALAGDHRRPADRRGFDLLAEPAHTGANQRQRPRSTVLTHDRADRGTPTSTPTSPSRPARPLPGIARNAAGTCTCGRPAAAPGPWCCAHRRRAGRDCADVGSAATSAATASTAPRGCGRPVRESASRHARRRPMVAAPSPVPTAALWPMGMATPARSVPRPAGPVRSRRRGRAMSVSALPAAPRRARRAPRSSAYRHTATTRRRDLRSPRRHRRRREPIARDAAAVEQPDRRSRAASRRASSTDGWITNVGP